jgi:hypothetical protein
MKATYVQFKDGHAVFLESQFFYGGLLMVKAGLTEQEAKELESQLNSAIASLQNKSTDGQRLPK